MPFKYIKVQPVTCPPDPRHAYSFCSKQTKVDNRPCWGTTKRVFGGTVALGDW